MPGRLNDNFSRQARPPEPGEEFVEVVEVVEASETPPEPDPASLQRKRQELTWRREIEMRDVGGLAVEMVRRDRMNPDLLVSRAQEVLALEQRMHELDSLLVAEATARSFPSVAYCKCGAPLVAGVHFCGHCGRPAATTPAVLTCAHCGQPLPADVNFCPVCGNPAAAGELRARAGARRRDRGPAAGPRGRDPGQDVSTPPREPPPAGEPSEPARPESPQEEQHGGPRCPRCGAPHDPLQEYCLECGLRLVRLPSQRYTRTTVWSRESPFWLWAALGTLLLLALAAGAIVALAATDEEEPEASPGISTLGPTTGTTATVPPPTADTLTSQTTVTIPPPTGTSTTTPTLPTTTQPTTSTGATTTNGDEIIDWPAGTDGYSVFLRSTPTSEGRGPADSAARQAIDDGLPQVGVLNSSEFDSLNPGYYVTFTGVYTSKSQAEGALPNARSKGFSTAYVRRVAD